VVKEPIYVAYLTVNNQRYDMYPIIKMQSYTPFGRMYREQQYKLTCTTVDYNYLYLAVLT